MTNTFEGAFPDNTATPETLIDAGHEVDQAIERHLRVTVQPPNSRTAFLTAVAGNLTPPAHPVFIGKGITELQRQEMVDGAKVALANQIKQAAENLSSKDPAIKAEANRYCIGLIGPTLGRFQTELTTIRAEIAAKVEASPRLAGLKAVHTHLQAVAGGKTAEDTTALSHAREALAKVIDLEGGSGTATQLARELAISKHVRFLGEMKSRFEQGLS